MARSILKSLITRQPSKAKIKIPVGIVGLGGWGHYNLTAMLKTDRFLFLGGFDQSEAARDQAHTEFDLPIYPSYEALLKQNEIRLICLTLPNHLHVPFIRKAADSGKHVFVEKPLASSQHECIEIGQYCANRGVNLYVGHQFHFEPFLCRIKEVISSHQFGPVIHFRMIRTRIPRHEDWRVQSTYCPMGPAEQLGIHLFDAVCYLFGRSFEMTRHFHNIPILSREKPNWAHYTLFFSNGLSGSIDTSYSINTTLFVEIFFQNARILFDGTALSLIHNEKRSKLAYPKTPASIKHFHQLADFVDKGIPSENDYLYASDLVYACSGIQ
ncbi:MAG: hypothetical protein A2293_16955 [Elusimicrobia bacterium RIFOXYB2_FULL_49_7]|nr:MAG: hypothetical protein A2293_16955 [Elusimicrobia bacterium RIFOXYB2_FULL_49_7]